MIHPQGYTISNWDGATLRQQELNSGWDVAFPRERVTFPSREFNSNSTGSVWLLTKNDLRAFDGTHWTLYPLHRIGLPNSTDTGEATALSAIGLPGTENILAAGCRFAGDVPVQGITPRILKDGTWQDFTEFGDYPCVTQLGTGDNGTVYAAQTSVL